MRTRGPTSSHLHTHTHTHTHTLSLSLSLSSSHLWRAVAADRRGAGIGARARDVGVLVVAAGPWGVPSRAVGGWRWRLLWRRLWRRWLLWRRLLLGSPVIAASVVGVVVVPVVVTPAVLVVATTSTAVETCIGEAGKRPHCSDWLRPSGVGLSWGLLWLQRDHAQSRSSEQVKHPLWLWLPELWESPVIKAC